MKVKVIVALVGIVLLAVILAAVHFIGPLFGFWLIPLSPKAHGEHAISLMDHGLHANGPQWQTKRAEALEAIGKARSREEVTPIIEDALAVAGGQAFLPDDRCAAQGYRDLVRTADQPGRRRGDHRAPARIRRYE